MNRSRSTLYSSSETIYLSPRRCLEAPPKRGFLPEDITLRAVHRRALTGLHYIILCATDESFRCQGHIMYRTYRRGVYLSRRCHRSVATRSIAADVRPTEPHRRNDAMRINRTSILENAGRVISDIQPHQKIAHVNGVICSNVSQLIHLQSLAILFLGLFLSASTTGLMNSLAVLAPIKISVKFILLTMRTLRHPHELQINMGKIICQS